MSLRRILMISDKESMTSQAKAAGRNREDHWDHLLGLSRGLARHDFVVDIVTPQVMGQPAVEAVDHGVQVFRVANCGDDRICAGHPEHDLMTAVLNHSHLRHQHYELIHSHSWNVGLTGSALGRAWKIPHIHTPYSLGALERNRMPASNAVRPTMRDERLRCERMIFHQADLVISTSAWQTRCLMESDEYNVPVEKIAEIPPGYDDEIFFRPHPGQRTVTKELLGWSAPTLLAAGGSPFSSGYEQLIRVFSVVLRRSPTAQLMLMIATANPTSEERRRMTELKMLAGELGIGSRTHMIQAVSRAGFADYYRAADVFIDCRDDETINMAAIEAMACGTPTIVMATRQPDEELLWGHDALCWNRRDANTFADSIGKISRRGLVKIGE
jgi:mannosylfructose-phosphate synthase